MENVLFLMHGMGEHAKGWSADVVAKLDEVAARYPAFSTPGSKAFSQRLDLVEICYDDVFKETVDGWQSSAAALAAFEKKGLSRLASWLQKPLPTEAKGFFWTTAIDPLFYRGFELERDRVLATVTSQIAKGVETGLKNGAASFSLLAHSLGTAVAHDALHALGSAPFQGNESLTAKRFQFANVFMLADVCSVGPASLRPIKYFDSCVRPTTAGTADNTYCQFFLNAWHRFDPFVAAGPFRPASWGDNYIPIGPLEHFHQANIHGYLHYLDHPLVHVPIINGALGRPLITDVDQKVALDKYPVTPAAGCDAQIAALKLKAQELEHAGADLEDLIIGLSEFLATAKQAADACKTLGDKGMFV